MNGKLYQWVWIPVTILGINFLIRLIDQSQIIFTFPLDYTNDISSDMARVFFLAKCGLHNYCPYWYNGFIAFKGFSLGWSLFTLPLYLLTKNILVATYISIILIYIISLIFLFTPGKIERFSNLTTIAFFVFIFGNAIAIGNFIKLGRIVSLFAYMLFLGLALLIFYYKNHRIDKKFFLFFIPLYTMILISHQREMILSQRLVLGLFLIKDYKDKIKILIGALSGFLISSFWTVPFIFNLRNVRELEVQSRWLLSFSKTNLLTDIASILIPLVLMILLYLYWISKNKSKREFIFFLPVLIISILFLSRIIIFLPILRNISPDPYLMFFLFFIVFLFFKTDLGKYRTLSIFLLMLASILSVTISIAHTPYFISHSNHDKEIISLLPKIEGKFIMISTPPDSYSFAYYSYAAIYYNLSTPDGWYRHMVDKEYIGDIDSMYFSFLNRDCNGFLTYLKKIGGEEVIGYLDDCRLLYQCGLKEKIKKDHVCLFTL